MVKKLFLKFIIACLAAFFALFLLEVLLRFFWNPPFLDPKYQRDDLAWLEKDVNLNRYNYRDREYTLAKKPGVFRVYVLGDSYTFGWYIKDLKLSYPKILETQLQNKYGKENIEVINASRHGFNIQEEYNRFREEGVKFNPDLVINGVNIFDFVNIKNPPPIIKNSTIRNLRLYRATLGVIDRARTSQNTLKTFNDAYQDNSPQMQKVNEIFAKFNQTAQPLGIKIVLLIFPNYNPASPNQTYQFQSYHDQIKKIAAKNSIPTVDLLQPFDTYQDKNQLILNPTDPHPSILADQIAGEYLFGNIDFGGLITDQAIPFNILQTTVHPGMKLDNAKVITAIGSNNWVYLDERLGSGIQKLFLPPSSDRKIFHLEDSLQITQGFTNNGWPGAKLTYYLPADTTNISLPLTLYNYPVVGISSVTVFYKQGGGLVSKDLKLSDISIKKNKKEINISFEPHQKPVLYKITADVAVKQFDISQTGEAEKFSSTKVARQELSAGQTGTDIEIGFKIGSLPLYHQGIEITGYVWLDNKLTPAVLKNEETKINIELLTPPNQKSVIEFPYISEIKTEDLTLPTIDYLSF